MNTFIRFAICSVMLIACTCSDIPDYLNTLNTPNAPNAPNAPQKKWSPLGSGFDGSVNDLCNDPSENIYAGGNFTTVGDTSAKYIAKWDVNTSTWTALDSGMSNTVLALCSDPSGNIYAGGFFTNAGGNPALHIAKWDGSTWTALISNGDNGVNGSVSALCSDADGNIYAGGAFTTAGGTPAKYIAKWDVRTSTWTALGSGVTNGMVGTLCSDVFGNIYAGGNFTIVGDTSAKYIAKWDVSTSTWTVLGSGVNIGMNYFVNALCSDALGNIYAGGNFTTAGGNPANYIAKWDVSTSTWTALASNGNNGVSFTVYSLCSDALGNIYVGGDFATAGGNPALHIAKWDGSTWTALISNGNNGMDDEVNALCSDPSGNIYAGGYGVTSSSSGYVAVWK